MVVLFKPTLTCNIKCAHCYVGDRRQEQTTVSVDHAVQILSKLPRESQIIFHGGGATLLGVDFYRTVTRHFLGFHTFAMQTNLLMIDELWVPIIKQVLNGSLSTSFDIGSSHRPIDAAIWHRNLATLKRNGISPYVVSIISRQNQDRSAELFTFFHSLGLSFRLNPIFKIGASHKHFKTFRHTGQGYAAAVNNIFDLWFMDPEANIVVDPCAEVLSFYLLGTSHRKCPFTSKCATHILCVEPNGDVLPCAGFDSLGEFSYGNLIKQPYSAILSSEKRTAAQKRSITLPEKCLACEYVRICQGGCRLEAYSYYGDLYHETSLCADYREIFSHIGKAIDREKGDIADWLLALTSRQQDKGIAA